MQKIKIVIKSTSIILVILICFSFTGCNKVNDMKNEKKSENISTVPVSPTMVASLDTSIEKNTSSSKVEVKEAEPDIEAVDYSDCFDGIEGCAVFLNSNTNMYKMYNKELCEKRSSPNSTFKIISTLIGLENGVIKSVDSKMGYDGTIYSNDKWNKNLGLKEAFSESCVWYFRKVIDHIGQNEVQKWLDRLKYGNCDISEWNGNGMNRLPELNGFWLDSSLKISPKEQVDILEAIFEVKTNFSKQNIAILKEIMLAHKYGNVSVYGKTGTGINATTRNMDNGWFVGVFEKSDKRYYFAVHLNDEKRKDVWGPKAKEIALNIIHKYYIEK